MGISWPTVRMDTIGDKGESEKQSTGTLTTDARHGDMTTLLARRALLERAVVLLERAGAL